MVTQQTRVGVVLGSNRGNWQSRPAGRDTMEKCSVSANSNWAASRLLRDRRKVTNVCRTRMFCGDQEVEGKRGSQQLEWAKLVDFFFNDSFLWWAVIPLEGYMEVS